MAAWCQAMAHRRDSRLLLSVHNLPFYTLSQGTHASGKVGPGPNSTTSQLFRACFLVCKTVGCKTLCEMAFLPLSLHRFFYRLRHHNQPLPPNPTKPTAGKEAPVPQKAPLGRQACCTAIETPCGSEGASQVLCPPAQRRSHLTPEMSTSKGTRHPELTHPALCGTKDSKGH